MLEPSARAVYLGELRPPEGYTLDRAIATTFSLDLLSLLMAPVSMAVFETEGKEDVLRDPTAVLEALRRVSGRLAVFCQQGRIAVPKASTLLYSYLEPVVHEVRLPAKHSVFHPKVWLLRFVSPDQAVRYRFLCLSRNLTFDTSWDTVLALDGILQNRQRGFGRNQPLVDFVRGLPGLAASPVRDECKDMVALLSDEVSRVRFEPPTWYEGDFEFIPIGIPGHKRSPAIASNQRTLVMSPFLSEDVLKVLATQGKDNVLISRAESLDALSDAALSSISTRAQVFAMQDDAQRPEESGEGDASGLSANDDLSGLHAKLFIAESGWGATVLTGSANATRAALGGGNVEFMVKLQGQRAKVGINALLGKDNDKESFRKLLMPYERPVDQVAPDSIREALEASLQEARVTLAGSGLSVDVVSIGEDEFTMNLISSIPTDPSVSGVAGAGEIFIQAYPISLSENAAHDLAPLYRGETITFPGLSMASLTGFFAFVLTARREGRTLSTSFVLNLPVSGMPEGREKRIFGGLISDKGRFIRYLLFLLAEGDESGNLLDLLMRASVTDEASQQRQQPDIPLLEELVRSFSRQPEKIDRISALIEDMKATAGGGSVLPEGFDKIWGAFLAARQRSRPNED